MARQHPQDLARLQAAGITMDTLPVYLGWNDTPAAKRERTARAIFLLESYGVVPRRGEGPDVPCHVCGAVFGTVTDRARYGWRFKCPNGHRCSPTCNTFLFNARLEDIGAGTILRIIQCFVERISVKACEAHLQLAHDTVVAWYSYCRDVARKTAWHDYVQIGGPTDVVEIDETHLFKRKYNVGRQMMYRHIWLFGGISRTTNKRFGVLVDYRDQDTLIAVMQQCIDSDSYICSDQWAAYGRVGDVFAGHGTVNHSVHFINPPRDEDPIGVPEGRSHDSCLDRLHVGPPPAANLLPFRIHTNRTERSWRDLKEQLRTLNTLDLCDTYIGEWMYRRNVLDGVIGPSARFERFLRDIAR